MMMMMKMKVVTAQH